VIASYFIGKSTRGGADPSPPNKVQWDLEHEG